jgi:hypothetical protein
MRQINDGHCGREGKHSPLQPPSASSPLILQSPVSPHPAAHVTHHHVLQAAASSTEPLKQGNRLIPSPGLPPPTHAIKSRRGSPLAPLPLLPLYPDPLPSPPHSPAHQNQTRKISSRSSASTITEKKPPRSASRESEPETARGEKSYDFLIPRCPPLQQGMNEPL